MDGTGNNPLLLSDRVWKGLRSSGIQMNNHGIPAIFDPFEPDAVDALHQVVLLNKILSKREFRESLNSLLIPESTFSRNWHSPVTQHIVEVPKVSWLIGRVSFLEEYSVKPVIRDQLKRYASLANIVAGIFRQFLPTLEITLGENGWNFVRRNGTAAYWRLDNPPRQVEGDGWLDHAFVLLTFGGTLIQLCDQQITA